MLNSSAYTASSPAALGQARRFYPDQSGDDMTMPIEVVPYDPLWPMLFAQTREVLTHALVGVQVVAIEHVGSTAVPGLAAKPVVDIDVIVERPHLEAAIRALERAGYTHRGELGITDRHSMAGPDAPRRHVYVTAAGSLALRNHLAVRDALRANATLRRAYGDLKSRLAEEAIDIGDYVERKTELLLGILASAGFTEPELDAIRAANRSVRRGSSARTDAGPDRVG